MSERYDIGIVGAGPAGLTAAYFAARAGARVVLLDRKTPPGQKILISGGGRCNILPTHVEPGVYVTDSSPHLVRRVLAGFPLAAVRDFLTGPVGLDLHQEGEKVYPRGGGREAHSRLIGTVKHYGARLLTGADVVGVKKGHIALETGEKVLASRIILATGGMSYPRTGSDGTGYRIARRLGHTVIDPYPALVALRGGTAAHHALAGVTLPVRLAIGEGKSRIEAEGDFLFTHRGYSGPVVLNTAHAAARVRMRGEHPPITVGWNRMGREEWRDVISPSRKTIRGRLREELPLRLVDLLLSEAIIPGGRKLSELRRDERKRILDALSAYRLPWTGTEGFSRAEVTGGGVSLREIDPKTMQSRVHPWLYLCGEILDAFGPIGGYNFLWAFSTGALAGRGAAA